MRGRHADIARPIAWAFTIWGVALYWWAGVLYLRAVPAARAAATGMTSAPAQSSRALSTAYLTDLVTNTLDPGYAAATARRRADRDRRWWDRWNRRWSRSAAC